MEDIDTLPPPPPPIIDRIRALLPGQCYLVVAAHPVGSVRSMVSRVKAAQGGTFRTQERDGVLRVWRLS